MIFKKLNLKKNIQNFFSIYLILVLLVPSVSFGEEQNDPGGPGDPAVWVPQATMDNKSSDSDLPNTNGNNQSNNLGGSLFDSPNDSPNDLPDNLQTTGQNNNIPNPNPGSEYPFDEFGNYLGEEYRTPNPIPQRNYQDGSALGEQPSVGGAFFECSATSILANALSTAIKNAIAQVFGIIFGLEVPVIDSKVRFKEAGFYLFGFIPLIPSWDSFGYCLANKTIAYISDATIQWIRSGFEGNPAFIENPERFFRQVADLEYENFLEGVAAEMACDPFRIEVINTLAGSYNRKFEDYGKCSLYDGGGNVDGFLNGAFNYDVWYRYTQNPANNPIGSAHLLKAELTNRISQNQNTISLELDWGNGFLPWKDMEGNTVSPGNVIESQLEQKLGLDSDRLALADEFDEVINELVNYLVKLALDETLGVLNGN